MRVLCVEHKTVWAGGQVAFTNVLREWQRAHASIAPLVMCPPDAALAPRLREWNIAVETFPLGAIEKTRGLMWNGAQHFVPTLRLLQTMRCTRAQVILANGAFSFLAAVAAAKIARVPIVWWDHTPILPREKMWRRMVAWADKIIVVSESQRAQFLEMDSRAREKIVLIHNGVNVTPNEMPSDSIRRALGWTNENYVVGTVSRLSPEKGIAHFLQVAANITQKIPSARFLLVGDGDERADLEQRATQLHLAERVRFVGFRQDVAACFDAMDVVLFASHAEAFSMAVLEAMARARAIVATDVGGVREQIVDGESGMIVPPRDVEAMTRVVLELLRDENKRRTLGEAARARVQQNFSVTHQAAQIKNLLEQVASR